MTQKLNSIEKEINKYLTSARKSLQSYRENIQTAYEIFVAHYNTDLNYNSTPLLAIIKALNANDRRQMLEYIKASTNIDKAIFTDKGCSLKFVDVKDESKPLQVDNHFIDNHKWFEKAEKAEKAPVNLSTEQLEKRLQTLVELINTSDKITKQQAIGLLNKAITLIK